MDLLQWIDAVNKSPELQRMRDNARETLADLYGVSVGAKVRDRQSGRRGEIMGYEAYHVGGEWVLKARVRWQTNRPTTVSAHKLEILR